MQKLVCALKREPAILHETADMMVLNKGPYWLCTWNSQRSSRYYDDGQRSKIYYDERSWQDILNSPQKDHLDAFLARRYTDETARSWWDWGGQDGAGCVHRLDNETSGCLLRAKTKASFETLVSELQKHRITKIYICLVHGEVPPQKEILINDRIGVNNQNNVAYIDDRNGDWAETRVRCLGHFHADDHALYSLCHVKILSGRRHQIRIHMTHKRWPLVSDSKYNPLGYKDRCWCPRMFLHASTIVLSPGHEKHHIIAPLFDDLCRALACVRLTTDFTDGLIEKFIGTSIVHASNGNMWTEKTHDDAPKDVGWGDHKLNLSYQRTNADVPDEVNHGSTWTRKTDLAFPKEVRGAQWYTGANLTPLSRKLATVLRHRASGLGIHVRADGFALLSDVLLNNDLYWVIEQVLPGTIDSIHSTGTVPSQLLDVVRTIVSTSLNDGRPRFELWEDKSSGSPEVWIRATHKHSIPHVWKDETANDAKTQIQEQVQRQWRRYDRRQKEEDQQLNSATHTQSIDPAWIEATAECAIYKNQDHVHREEPPRKYDQQPKKDDQQPKEDDQQRKEDGQQSKEFSPRASQLIESCSRDFLLEHGVDVGKHLAFTKSKLWKCELRSTEKLLHASRDQWPMDKSGNQVLPARLIEMIQRRAALCQANEVLLLTARRKVLKEAGVEVIEHGVSRTSEDGGDVFQ